MNNISLEDRLFPILRQKQLEMAYVPPQRLGRLTSLYHRVTPWVKFAPWRLIAVWAVLATLFMRILLGSYFVSLASILQRAF